MASGVSEFVVAGQSPKVAEAEAERPEAIRINGLQVRYKLAANQYKTILDGLSLSIAEGEFVVPDDFDDPLPDELQRLFDGDEETMC